MAADRTGSGDPNSELPAISGQLNAPQPYEVPQTLAGKLVSVVDRLRQIPAKFGIRPYRVFLVHIRWSGQRIGEGNPEEISRCEITPIPRVTEMSSTTEVLRSIGLTEEGTLSVDRISPRFTEDDLMGRTPDLQDPELPRTGLDNVEFRWEVAENRPSLPASVRRAYKPSAVPSLSRDGFQWKVLLVKTDYDAGRQGSLMRRSF